TNRGRFDLNRSSTGNADAAAVTNIGHLADRPGAYFSCCRWHQVIGGQYAGLYQPWRGLDAIASAEPGGRVGLLRKPLFCRSAACGHGGAADLSGLRGSGCAGRGAGTDGPPAAARALPAPGTDLISSVTWVWLPAYRGLKGARHVLPPKADHL